MNLKFEKVKKKYALNNSYFKNRLPNSPKDPLEILEYVDQYDELPYSEFLHNNEGDHRTGWLYECFVEYQKRNKIQNEQFFTPPATARRMAELLDDIDIPVDPSDKWGRSYYNVLDVCCGYGELSQACQTRGFGVRGLDIDSNFAGIYDYMTKSSFTQFDITHNELYANGEQFGSVISNPPYKLIPEFFEFLDKVLAEGGYAVVLLPVGTMDKMRPVRLVDAMSKFVIIHRESMEEGFARTGTKAEIYVLKKYMEDGKVDEPTQEQKHAP